MNATLIERGAVRFTPAGLPVLEAQLRHQSTLIEAGMERVLDFSFDAIALGETATRLAAEQLGRGLALDGFLAPRGKRSTRILVHVQEFSRIET
jgi:primosomal replication protein N